MSKSLTGKVFSYERRMHISEGRRAGIKRRTIQATPKMKNPEVVAELMFEES
jgi:hypothetical protein